MEYPQHGNPLNATVPIQLSSLITHRGKELEMRKPLSAAQLLAAKRKETQ